MPSAAAAPPSSPAGCASPCRRAAILSRSAHCFPVHSGTSRTTAPPYSPAKRRTDPARRRMDLARLRLTPSPHPPPPARLDSPRPRASSIDGDEQRGLAVCYSFACPSRCAPPPPPIPPLARHGEASGRCSTCRVVLPASVLLLTPPPPSWGRLCLSFSLLDPGRLHWIWRPPPDLPLCSRGGARHGLLPPSLEAAASASVAGSHCSSPSCAVHLHSRLLLLSSRWADPWPPRWPFAPPARFCVVDGAPNRPPPPPVLALASSFKLEEDKNQLSKGLDPWSNPTTTSSTLHYLLQEKERAQAQEQLQIYQQQGFSYLEHHHRRQQQQQSRAGAGGDGVSSGESTPVDALATAFGSGRIVRSAAGRKDRHSKVCTARGLRDRRVRLAAHTAIRFYDVQDRLGYDRPSKAVDWLIRNAKAAIDELPDREEAAAPTTEAADSTEPAQQVTTTTTTSTSYGFGNPGGAGAISGGVGVGVAGSFIPHSAGANGVSCNVKSLFPSSSTASATPAHDDYRGSPPDLLSRTTTSQPQELCLTLQSNQHHHHQIFSHHGGMMSGAGVLAGWPEHGQRMPSWHASESSAGDGRSAGNGDSYMFGGGGVPPRQGLDHQGQLFSQGEPLQSSGGWASARTWLDPLAAIHQPSTTMTGQVGISHLVGTGGGLMGFLAPAAAHQRLQGEEEQGSDAMREQ
ncbi:hypothetical protein BS78_03G279900 [Paspalum vaginatum]|nr:hypothetical protein BS78_03G279900 [Paspalum vaginatum]